MGFEGYYPRPLCPAAQGLPWCGTPTGRTVLSTGATAAHHVWRRGLHRWSFCRFGQGGKLALGMNILWSSKNMGQDSSSDSCGVQQHWYSSGSLGAERAVEYLCMCQSWIWLGLDWHALLPRPWMCLFISLHYKRFPWILHDTTKKGSI